MTPTPQPGDRVVDFDTEYEIVSMSGTLTQATIQEGLTPEFIGELVRAGGPACVVPLLPPDTFYGVSKDGRRKEWKRAQLTKLPYSEHTWTDT